MAGSVLAYFVIIKYIAISKFHHEDDEENRACATSKQRYTHAASAVPCIHRRFCGSEGNTCHRNEVANKITSQDLDLQVHCQLCNTATLNYYNTTPDIH